MLKARGVKSAAVAGLAAVVVAGCASGPTVTHSGSNPSGSTSKSSQGFANLSANQILDKSKDALKGADAVRVSGSITQGDQVTDIDLKYSGTGSGIGTITVKDGKVEVIRAGSDLYLKANADFWNKATGNDTAGKLVGDKYLKVPSDNTDFATMADMLNLAKLGEEALKPNGEISKGSATKVNGKPGIELLDADGGKLVVASTGKPLPLRVVSKDGQTIDFDYPSQVTVTAPAASDVIDLNKLIG